MPRCSQETRPRGGGGGRCGTFNGGGESEWEVRGALVGEDVVAVRWEGSLARGEVLLVTKVGVRAEAWVENVGLGEGVVRVRKGAG